MTNYSELSDFEINQRVATFIFPGSEVQSAENMWPCDSDSAVQVIHKLGVHGEYVDYCNNPANAWPIIAREKITIIYSFVDEEWFCATDYINTTEGENWSHDSRGCNPLRAAMVVYLMMQEQQHER